MLFSRGHVARVYFNSRPSARGDAADKGGMLAIQFQFTPLREGRRVHSSAISLSAPRFQFTPLREGRPGYPARTAQAMIFQFTPLREGRRWNRDADAGRDTHFNSRPSARGDRMRGNRRFRPARISIHAPPRGATPLKFLRHLRPYISIHAPPRGATNRVYNTVAIGEFQFTPLREGRLVSISE